MAGDEKETPGKDPKKGWIDAAKAAGDLGLAFMGGIPSLTDLSKQTGQLEGSMAFLENSLKALQGFSSYGVRFNMSINEMIQTATSVRMSLPELAEAVSENSLIMTRFGGSVEQGLNTFLKAQSDFYKGLDGVGGDAAESLQRLGFSVTEINETFMQYDAIQSIGRRKEDRLSKQRNAAAFEFAQELDRLAALTGKRRDQLLEEMQENLRSGNVQARRALIEQRFGGDFAKAYDRNILTMSQFGDGIGNLTKDILTKGFPVGASKQLAALAPELYSALKAAKAAQDTGDLDEYNKQMRIAAYESSKLRKDERFRRLSELQGYNQIGDIAGEVFASTSQGLARTMEVVEQEAAKTGKSLTKDQVLAEALRLEEEKQQKRIADAKEKEGKAVTDMVIKLQESVYKASAATQAEVLDDIFKKLAGPAGGLSSLVDNLDPTSFFKKLTAGFDDLFARLGVEGQTPTSTAESALDKAQRQLPDQLFSQIQSLQALINQYNMLASQDGADQNKLSDLADQINKQTKELTKEIDANELQINANQIGIGAATIIVGNGTVIAPGRDKGSMGATGGLFENFGKGTLIEAHDMESIQRPQDTAAIVENSVMGALQAISNLFDMSAITNSSKLTADVAGNQSRTLQSMLNTVNKPNRQTEAAVMQSQPEIEQLKDLLARGFDSIKTPLEHVTGLKDPLERVARMSEEQLNVQKRTMKNTKGLSGDLLRG